MKKIDNNNDNSNINRSNFKLEKPKFTFRAMENQLKNCLDFKKVVVLKKKSNERL